MPAVLLPFVAVGVALLVLLASYALTVLFTPIIEGILKQVPFVGGVLASKAAAAGDWAANKIAAYANTTVDAVTSWFHGLATSARDFAASVNAYLVDLPGVLDHLTHVTVPALIRDAVNPVRATANAAEQDATDALAGIDAIAALPLTHFRGIEHGVRDLVDAARDIVENVDLPYLENTLDREIQRARDAADAGINDVGTLVDQEFGQVWDYINKIPLQQLLDGLAASAALGVLVQTITAEAGLDSAECRGKFKQVCSTDPAAWADLLALAGAAVVFPGLSSMFSAAREMFHELMPAVREVVNGG